MSNKDTKIDKKKDEIKKEELKVSNEMKSDEASLFVVDEIIHEKDMVVEDNLKESKKSDGKEDKKDKIVDTITSEKNEQGNIENS